MRPESRPSDIVRLLRPTHWLKNAFLFAPIVYAQRLFEVDALLVVAAAFLCFSLASSAVYIFNDLRDREADRRHPKKKERPIASGRVSPETARLLIPVLLLAAGACSLALPIEAVVGIGAYLLLNVGYSLGLKHVAILDIFIIASGFMLRVIVGAVAIAVPISNWIVICTLFLALFLAIAKRRREIANLGQADARPVLDDYTPELVRTIMIVSVTGTVMTYTLYTMDPGTIARFGTDDLIYTVPVVLFGLLRYLYVDEKSRGGENPVSLVVRDPSLILTALLWGILSVGIIYVGRL